LSNTGVTVIALSVVFHTPPVALAMYMVVGSDSSTATSVMRPDMVAGPMNRNRSVESIAESGAV
jgi:hypothetical protein